MRILHEVNAGCVDVVVGGLHVGVLGRDLAERALPQVARERQHIGLVDQRQVTAFACAGQLEAVPDGALGSHTSVDRALGRDLVRRAFAHEAAFACVGAFGVLADDGEAVAVRKGEGAQIHVQIEFEAGLEQQPALDDARRDFGRADGAEQDGVEGAQLFQGLVVEHRAIAQVAVTAQLEFGRRDTGAGSGNHIERDRGDLGPNSVSPDDCDVMSHCRVLCPIALAGVLSTPPGTA